VASSRRRSGTPKWLSDASGWELKT
jgi:hypothetical protein